MESSPAVRSISTGDVPSVGFDIRVAITKFPSVAIIYPCLGPLWTEKDGRDLSDYLGSVLLLSMPFDLKLALERVGTREKPISISGNPYSHGILEPKLKSSLQQNRQQNGLVESAHLHKLNTVQMM